MQIARARSKLLSQIAGLSRDTIPRIYMYMYGVSSLVYMGHWLPALRASNTILTLHACRVIHFAANFVASWVCRTWYCPPCLSEVIVMQEINAIYSLIFYNDISLCITSSEECIAKLASTFVIKLWNKKVRVIYLKLFFAVMAIRFCFILFCTFWKMKNIILLLIRIISK